MKPIYADNRMLDHTDVISDHPSAVVIQSLPAWKRLFLIALIVPFGLLILPFLILIKAYCSLCYRVGWAISRKEHTSAVINKIDPKDRDPLSL